MAKFTAEIIQAAIEGYEAQKTRIDEKIAELRGMGSGRASAPAAPAAAAAAEPGKRRKKRRLSAEGRAAIAEAARKRWAAFKAAKDGAKKKG